jgi:hypothetical protein
MVLPVCQGLDENLHTSMEVKSTLLGELHSFRRRSGGRDGVSFKLQTKTDLPSHGCVYGQFPLAVKLAGLRLRVTRSVVGTNAVATWIEN